MDNQVATREISQSVLTLRSDLVFSPRADGEKPGYLIEDPLSGKFYRIGQAEYTFLSLLDGKTTVGEATALTARAMPAERLTSSDIAGLCQWLVEADLAHTHASSRGASLLNAAERVRETKARRWLNPMTVQIPLLDPDRVLEALLPWTRWLFSPLSFALWLTLAAVGIYQLWDGAAELTAASGGILAPGRWIWLGVCWILLKVVHETAHGLVCKKYGGNVPEAGVMLILLAPIAYVDLTSSWRFQSRWERIATAAAGIYVEVGAAAIAAILFRRADPGIAQDMAFNVILMAGLGTLLFNINFLMRFDGYYIFADCLGIANLYQTGQQYVRYLGLRYVLGMTASPPRMPSGKSLLVKLYGLASAVWRVTVMVSLTTAAAALFHGAGIALAVVGLIAWVGRPMARLMKLLAVGEGGQRPRRLRFLAIVTTFGGSVTAILLWVPWPMAHRAPAIVAYEPFAVVRAASPGIAREIHVQDAQQVRSGQILLVLENRELVTQLETIRIELREASTRARSHQRKGEMAAYQAQRQAIVSLEDKIARKEEEVEGLAVRSPVDGRVLGRTLRWMEGTYFEAGDEIVAVGNDASKELRAAVPQDDVDLFTAHIGAPLRVRIAGAGVLSCDLAAVDPQASLKPPHPALLAPNGGPLSVRPVTSDDQNSTSREVYELLRPRFTAIVRLDLRQSTQLRCGQRTTVYLDATEESIGQHLHTLVRKWLRQRLGNSALGGQAPA